MNLITTYDKCGIREQPVDFGKRYLGTITVRKGAKELLSTISCSFMKNQSFTVKSEMWTLVNKLSDAIWNLS